MCFVIISFLQQTKGERAAKGGGVTCASYVRLIDVAWDVWGHEHKKELGGMYVGVQQDRRTRYHFHIQAYTHARTKSSKHAPAPTHTHIHMYNNTLYVAEQEHTQMVWRLLGGPRNSWVSWIEKPWIQEHLLLEVSFHLERPKRRIQQMLFCKRDTFSRTFFCKRNMIPWTHDISNPKQGPFHVEMTQGVGMCISHVHIPCAYPMCISHVHIPCAYPMCISHVHIPSLVSRAFFETCTGGDTQKLCSFARGWCRKRRRVGCRKRRCAWRVHCQVGEAVYVCVWRDSFHMCDMADLTYDTCTVWYMHTLTYNMHICMCAYLPLSISACLCLSLPVSACLCLSLPVSACLCVCVRVCADIYKSIYVYICVCQYAYMLVHIHII